MYYYSVQYRTIYRILTLCSTGGEERRNAPTDQKKHPLSVALEIQKPPSLPPTKTDAGSTGPVRDGELRTGEVAVIHGALFRPQQEVEPPDQFFITSISDDVVSIDDILCYHVMVEGCGFRVDYKAERHDI